MPYRLLSLLLALLLTACAVAPDTAPEMAALVLKPSDFTALSGWQQDHQSQAAQAFAKSCARIVKQKPEAGFGPFGGRMADWRGLCSRLTPALYHDDAAARRFFESEFSVWQGWAGSLQQNGLFTGYYEASLQGSRTRHDQYQTPLRRRPGDLVMVDLGAFRPALKGQRIAGRVVDGNLKPYPDHRAIDAGELPDDAALPLAWVDDPVQAFFLQIQGSGRIILDDGTIMRIGYAGQNGQPYYAVGRELVRRGALRREEVSMQSIAAWLKANPDQADAVMQTNPSYVFFKELPGDGPLGAENVTLTPERSLAVDPVHIPYGVPVFLSVNRQLMVAQDTGGAIRGPIRGDIFFGYGPDAESRAGPMKQNGQWWFLLPRGVVPQ